MKKILELNKAGKTARQISRALYIPSTTVLRDLKMLKKQGFEVNDNSKTYFKNTKWYKIIERTNKELNFYRERGIVPTLRKMTYRLIELGVLEKKDYDEFSKKTAEARRGVDSKYTKTTKLPRLPIDCFRDDKRIVIGQTDVDEEPIQPTPAEPPEDPDEYITNEISKLKQAPGNYDGKRQTEGEEGRPGGRWHKQPTYVEIWVESETLQQDLLKFQEGRNVCVTASGGQVSTPYMYANCKRIRDTVVGHKHFKKVVIIYFKDYDKAGEYIARNQERGIKWYLHTYFGLKDIEVEFKRIAVTEDQIKKYKLIENPEKKHNVQLEAFLTNDTRLSIFKKILQDAIDAEWDEDVYYYNCPSKKYDYESKGEEEPQDIDPDSVPDDSEDGLTTREKMFKTITEAFYPGWDISEGYKSNNKNVSCDGTKKSTN
jgi:DNA-binding Lrp family transcriptional regulator